MTENSFLSFLRSLSSAQPVPVHDGDLTVSPDAARSRRVGPLASLSSSSYSPFFSFQNAPTTPEQRLQSLPGPSRAHVRPSFLFHQRIRIGPSSRSPAFQTQPSASTSASPLSLSGLNQYLTTRALLTDWNLKSDTWSGHRRTTALVACWSRSSSSCPLCVRSSSFHIDLTCVGFLQSLSNGSQPVSASRANREPVVSPSSFLVSLDSRLTPGPALYLSFFSVTISFHGFR